MASETGAVVPDNGEIMEWYPTAPETYWVGRWTGRAEDLEKFQEKFGKGLYVMPHNNKVCLAHDAVERLKDVDDSATYTYADGVHFQITHSFLSRYGEERCLGAWLYEPGVILTIKRDDYNGGYGEEIVPYDDRETSSLPTMLRREGR